MEILKGKWRDICCTIVLVLAVGNLILEEINDDKSHAVGREVGVQQIVTSKRHLHA
jgi:hypothetical protein